MTHEHSHAHCFQPARNETNLDADWVFFKDPSRCRSRDCDAVRQFHHSGVVQCGYLIIAWKDSDALFHFIVDGSRARDMAAGVFHFEAPLDNGVLATARVADSRVEPCFSLQTRNQGDSDACDGYYIKYDTALQLNSGDDYKLSTLDWPVWLLVVGSVAAAAAAVLGVAVFTYRLRHADASDSVNDELLRSVDNDDVSAAKRAGEATLPIANRPLGELRQRALSPRSSTDDAGANASADAV